jgi:outer membrane immunogenic protein
MRRFFITAVVSIAAAGAVFAADIPPAPPPPVRAPAAYIPVMPVYNWGGIYVGVNGGYGFGTTKWTAPFGGLSNSLSDNGGIAGGTLGFNYQMNAFVFGVEGDFDWSGINTGTSSTLCSNLIIGGCQTGNNWLSTLRGRFGVAVDRLLIFGTAGGAFGNAQTVLNGVTTTHTKTGWTAGVGAEYAFAQNWTAKVEYLYVDLGTTTANVTCVAGAVCAVVGGVAPGTIIPISVGLTDNLIRAGVNYKFNF